MRIKNIKRLAITAVGLALLSLPAIQRAKEGWGSAKLPGGTNSPIEETIIIGITQAYGSDMDTISIQYPKAKEWAISASGPFTVHLPAVMKYYDPDWVSPFGVTMYGAITDTTGLKQVREVGMKWITTMLSWRDIEPSDTDPAYYNWSKYDAKFSNASNAGLNIIVLFTGNPSWAAEYPGGPVYKLDELKEFLGAMVERYDGDGIEDAPGNISIKYWQLYAEPDNASEEEAKKGKGYWGYKGADFAEMLKEVQPVMKAADPESKIMIGGLAYDNFITPTLDCPGPYDDKGIFANCFLTDTLEAGAGEYIDMMAFHYFPFYDYRWGPKGNIAKAKEIRSILANYGLEDVPMISPETGDFSTRTPITETEQARQVVKIFVRGMSADLKIMCWFKVVDSEGGRRWGLLYHDLTPKPSYTSTLTLIKELTGAYYKGPFDGGEHIEGYVFSTRGGMKEKIVLWAVPNAPPGLRFSFSVGRHRGKLRVVEMDGDEFIIEDGDPQHDLDGQINGQVEIDVFQDPRYVEVYP
jgi:hypothetical protein